MTTATDQGAKLKILAADRAGPLAEFDKRAAEIGAEVIYGDATKPEQIGPLAVVR